MPRLTNKEFNKSQLGRALALLGEAQMTSTPNPKETDKAIFFLGKAGRILSESLDYETILKATAVLVLDFLADVCFIDLLEENNGQEKYFRRILSMSKDVSQDTIANEMSNYSPKSELDPLVRDIIRYREGRFIDDFVVELKRNKAESRYIHLVEKMQCGPAVIMPLESHDKIFGVLTLVRSYKEPKYSKVEIELITEFARRAAMAIENARLYRQAQLAVEAKTQFLANMSHEIRTPLGVMLGFVELLLEHDMPYDQQKHYLNIISRNGHQLLELVGDLLDLSRIDLGKIEINPLEIVPVELVNEVVSEFSMKANEKKIKILVDYESTVPFKILTDPLRVRQVLINLLNNAIKFSFESVIEVKVKCTPFNNHFRFVIDVIDHGIGISPEKQGKLFQAFVQADITMTRKFGGAGLGLFLSKKIAKALGGDVGLVTSDLGKGSVFRFSFISEGVSAHAEKSEVADTHETSPITRVGAGPVKKVLVVEDSLDNQFLISKFLEDENLEIDKAQDGEEAVQKASQKKYDLILMDIQMPVVDGYTATLRLRRMGVKTPIVAITAHAMAGDREHCEEVGCNGYVTKPLEKISFRNTVRSFL